MKQFFKNAKAWLKQKIKENWFYLVVSGCCTFGSIKTLITEEYLLFAVIMFFTIAHFVRPLKKNEKDQD